MSLEKAQYCGDAAERIAKEYEDFAYIVSHDFNAPLRHIKEFTRLLVESKQEDLNEDEREYMNHLENAFIRIENMQQSLLSFSRVNTLTQDHQDIDTKQLIENVLSALEGEILEYNPSIEKDELPNIYGDPTQIHTVFLNIIANAIKFHEDKSARKISVTATNNGDKATFTIRDNGIGIEEAFHTEIFKMFRCLHPAGTYPGNGAGLTIAKKIIERHGGTIHVESKPHEGTKVIFSLPQK